MKISRQEAENNPVLRSLMNAKAGDIIKLPSGATATIEGTVQQALGAGPERFSDQPARAFGDAVEDFTGEMEEHNKKLRKGLSKQAKFQEKYDTATGSIADAIVQGQKEFLEQKKLTADALSTLTSSIKRGTVGLDVLQSDKFTEQLSVNLQKAYGIAPDDYEKQRVIDKAVSTFIEDYERKSRTMFKRIFEYSKDKFSELTDMIKSDFNEIMGPIAMTFIHTAEKILKPIGKFLMSKVLLPLAKGAGKWVGKRVGAFGGKMVEGGAGAGTGGGVGTSIGTGVAGASWSAVLTRLLPLLGIESLVAGAVGLAAIDIVKQHSDKEYAKRVHEYGSAEAASFTMADLADSIKEADKKQTTEMLKGEEKNLDLFLGAGSWVSSLLSDIWKGITGWLNKAYKDMGPGDAAPEAPLPGGITPGGIDAQNRQKDLMKLYTDAGLKPHQAAGIVGNIGVETGGTFDPRTIQKGKMKDEDRGKGILQWDAKRYAAGEKWAKEQGFQGDFATNLEAQAKWSLYEMQHGGEKKSWESLQAAKDVREATTVFGRDNERPKDLGASLEKRIKYGVGAQNVFEGRAADAGAPGESFAGKYQFTPEDAKYFIGGEKLTGLNTDYVERLKQAAINYGEPLPIDSGYRSAGYQAKLYQNYLGRGKAGAPVAPGGTSFHEEAGVDFNQKWIKGNKQAEAALRAAGLAPLSDRGGSVGMEDWHYQPAETLGMSLAQYRQSRGALASLKSTSPTVAQIPQLEKARVDTEVAAEGLKTSDRQKMLQANQKILEGVNAGNVNQVNSNVNISRGQRQQQQSPIDPFHDPWDLSQGMLVSILGV